MSQSEKERERARKRERETLSEIGSVRVVMRTFQGFDVAAFLVSGTGFEAPMNSRPTHSQRGRNTVLARI